MSKTNRNGVGHWVGGKKNNILMLASIYGYTLEKIEP